MDWIIFLIAALFALSAGYNVYLSGKIRYEAHLKENEIFAGKVEKSVLDSVMKQLENKIKALRELEVFYSDLLERKNALSTKLEEIKKDKNSLQDQVNKLNKELFVIKQLCNKMGVNIEVVADTDLPPLKKYGLDWYCLLKQLKIPTIEASPL